LGYESALISPLTSLIIFRRAYRPASSGTLSHEQDGQQNKNERKPNAVHRQHFLRRGIGFKQHVGIPLRKSESASDQ
jgi:hypothetical protein